MFVGPVKFELAFILNVSGRVLYKFKMGCRELFHPRCGKRVKGVHNFSLS